MVQHLLTLKLTYSINMYVHCRLLDILHSYNSTETISTKHSYNSTATISTKHSFNSTAAISNKHSFNSTGQYQPNIHTITSRNIHSTAIIYSISEIFYHTHSSETDIPIHLNGLIAPHIYMYAT